MFRDKTNVQALKTNEICNGLSGNLTMTSKRNCQYVTASISIQPIRCYSHHSEAPTPNLSSSNHLAQ